MQELSLESQQVESPALMLRLILLCTHRHLLSSWAQYSLPCTSRQLHTQCIGCFGSHSKATKISQFLYKDFNHLPFRCLRLVRLVLMLYLAVTAITYFYPLFLALTLLYFSWSNFMPGIVAALDCTELVQHTTLMLASYKCTCGIRIT